MEIAAGEAAAARRNFKSSESERSWPGLQPGSSSTHSNQARLRKMADGVHVSALNQRKNGGSTNGHQTNSWSVDSFSVARFVLQTTSAWKRKHNPGHEARIRSGPTDRANAQRDATAVPLWDVLDMKYTFYVSALVNLSQD